MNIAAVIPIRKGSQRVPGKNFIPFYKDKSLLELKIETLLNVPTIDRIIVNTDSDTAIKIAKSYGVEYFKREDYYASSKCSGSEFFHNLALTTDSDIIIHTPCTSPFVKSKTYFEIINKFSLSKGYDSINTVTEVKEFLWKDGKALNYNPAKAPNSQDLPDIVKLTFGVNMISKEEMLKRSNVVGKNLYSIM